MRYLFGCYSYSFCLWGLRAGWLAGFFMYCMLCFVFMCILVNLWWHLFILKKLAAWAYLMSLGGNCGKSGQTNFNFCMMLPVGVVLCMPGQYRWLHGPIHPQYVVYGVAVSPWLNYVPRKMPDVRSRYALYTNMRRFIYCMLYLLYECSAAFTIRSVPPPLINIFSHDSFTKIRPLPLISLRLLFILYCYNLQTRCISLVMKFQTTL